MTTTIVEVLIEVGFTDGDRAVFSVSPSGKLRPGLVKWCSREHWIEAADEIISFNSKISLPSPDTSCECSRVLEWPWYGNDEDPMLAEECLPDFDDALLNISWWIYR